MLSSASKDSRFRLNLAAMQRAGLFLLVVLAILVQFFAASQKSFWEDEMHTATVAENTAPQILAKYSKDVHPPLQYLLYSFWGRVFGYQETGLRLLSIGLICLVFFLTYQLSLLLFDFRTGAIALVLLAFSAFFLTYGINVRYYALSAVLTLLALFVTVRYFSSKNLLYLLGYVLAGVALVYTVYTGFFVLLFCFLWGVGLWWRGGRQKLPGVLWLLSQFAIILAFLPWVPFMLGAGNRHFQLPALGPGLVFDVLKRLVYLLYAYTLGVTISPLHWVAWIGLVVFAILAVRIVLEFRRLPGNWWALFACFGLLTGLAILISILTIYPVSNLQSIPYHIFYVYPIFVMLLAYVIGRMKQATALALIAIILVIGLFGMYNYFTGRQFLTPILNVPWKEIVAEIQAERTPDAAVICDGKDASCFYYLNRIEMKAYRPKAWQQLKEENHSQVWWIQTNLGELAYDEQAEQSVLDDLARLYQTSQVANYAPNDPSIRTLKTKFMHQKDYAYRLQVYHFSDIKTPQ